MTETKPVAGYYRVSVARDDMKAPEIYTDEIERYCGYKRLSLSRIYSDIDRSGWRGAPARPALEELIKDRQLYSAVIVPKLSRFGRSVSNLVQLFDLFDRDGIALVFLDLNLDTSTSQGRLLRNVMAAFAEYESDVKSDYSKANARRRALDGLPATGHVPLGYVRRNHTFVVDGKNAELVRHIFELYAGGESTIGITARLNRDGVPCPGGGLWRRMRVVRLLSNPAYVAMRRSGGQLLPGKWPPIVEREIWDRVQERLAEARARVGARHGGRPRYLLVGLLVCGVCGHNLTHWKGGQHMYACHRLPDGIRRCSGGRVVLERAESIVLTEFFACYPAAELRRPDGSLERQVPMQEAWDQATMDQRRDLLRLVIDRIVLVPRPDPAPRKVVRTLEIVWSEAKLEGDRVEPLPARIVPRSAVRRRRCNKCGEEKPLEAFHRERNRREGRATICAECRNRDQALAGHAEAVVADMSDEPGPPSPRGLTCAVAAGARRRSLGDRADWRRRPRAITRRRARRGASKGKRRQIRVSWGRRADTGGVAQEEPAQAPSLEGHFYDLEGVARYLSVSVPQVYALVRSGELPAIKIGGRGVWRVGRKQLEDFVERLHEETATWTKAHPLNPKERAEADPGE